MATLSRHLSFGAKQSAISGQNDPLDKVSWRTGLLLMLLGSLAGWAGVGLLVYKLTWLL